MKHVGIYSILLLGVSLYAQDAKVPKLKDSVALELRTLQLQITNMNVQILQLQQQQAQVNNQYVAHLQTALKDSDLDDTKYELDAGTLVVKEKPQEKPKK